MRSVAGTGCFSTTARMFGVSQPTVSNAISDLEEELKGKLFRRTRRSVELTPFGLNIVGRVDAIVHLIEEIQREAEQHTQFENPLIRIAFSPVVDGLRLFGLLESFRASRQGPDLVYRELPKAELESGLADARLDIVCGIFILDQPGFCRCPLYRERLRFLPAGGKPSPGNPPPVSLADISTQTLILPAEACGFASAIRHIFRQQKLALTEYAGHPLSYAALKDWAHEGIGAAILPESKAGFEASRYPAIVADTEEPLTITVEAVWRRSHHDAGARQLIRYLRDNALIVA